MCRKRALLEVALQHSEEVAKVFLPWHLEVLLPIHLPAAVEILEWAEIRPIDRLGHLLYHPSPDLMGIMSGQSNSAIAEELA